MHDEEAQTLLGKGSPLEESIIESLHKLEAAWARYTSSSYSLPTSPSLRLSTLTQSRSHGLTVAHTLHKYLEAIRKGEQWSADMVARMASVSKADTVAQAAHAVDAHSDRCAR